MTLPSPSQFPAIAYQTGLSDQFYPTRSDLLWEIAGLHQGGDRRAAGGRDRLHPDRRAALQLLRRSALAGAFAGVGRGPGRDVRGGGERGQLLPGRERKGPAPPSRCTSAGGNNQSKWYAEGGYEAIAERLFGSLAVDRFLLEYDTERAGTFEPLRFMPDDKMVVLGLVSSKEAAVESRGIPAGAHRGGQPVRPAGAAGSHPAMRVCINRRRQPAHRGRPMAEAGAGG